jgi:hypothetical protein
MCGKAYTHFVDVLICVSLFLVSKFGIHLETPPIEPQVFKSQKEEN